MNNVVLVNGKLYRQLRCNARNMPPDHDEGTAFFMVPIDAPHGLLLGCSHPICRKRPQRFRYCAVCRIPVSKRNFHGRHSHAMEDGTVPTEGGPYTPPTLRNTNESETHSSSIASTTQTSLGQQSDASSARHQQLTPEARTELSRGNFRQSQKVAAKPPPEENSSDSEGPAVLDSDEVKWLEFFRNRPDLKDKKQAEEWKQSVVAFATTMNNPRIQSSTFMAVAQSGHQPRPKAELSPQLQKVCIQDKPTKLSDDAINSDASGDSKRSKSSEDKAMKVSDDATSSDASGGSRRSKSSEDKTMKVCDDATSSDASGASGGSKRSKSSEDKAMKVSDDATSSDASGGSKRSKSSEDKAMKLSDDATSSSGSSGDSRRSKSNGSNNSHGQQSSGASSATGKGKSSKQDSTISDGISTIELSDGVKDDLNGFQLDDVF